MPRLVTWARFTRTHATWPSRNSVQCFSQVLKRRCCHPATSYTTRWHYPEVRKVSPLDTSSLLTLIWWCDALATGFPLPLLGLDIIYSLARQVRRPSVAYFWLHFDYILPTNHCEHYRMIVVVWFFMLFLIVSAITYGWAWTLPASQ